MKLLKVLNLVIVFILFSNFIIAQTVDDSPIISKKLNNLNTIDFFDQVSSAHDVEFFYHKDSLPHKTITVDQDSMSLLNVLQANFSEHNIQIAIENDNYYLLKNQQITTRLADNFFESRKYEITTADAPLESSEGDDYMQTYNKYINKIIEIGNIKKYKKNANVQLRGQVISAEDNEPIPQATIHIEELNKYVATDIDGHYSLQLNTGTYTMIINSMGCYEKKYRIKVLSAGELNTKLKRKSFMLDATYITASSQDNIKSTTMGLEKIEPKILKKMPVVMGELDLVKVSLMLPGVQTVNELSSGFNVRGSPADQNMFLIDNIPIYNVSHLFGMYSSFNSDLISDFSLYKSNIPIEFGGQLSSLFDIEAKNGNTEQFSARGGISPISSRFMAEGPIRKGKSSYIVGGRTTYSDWLLNMINEVNVKNSSASFSDGFIKLYSSPDTMNKFKFVGYGSQDKTDLAFNIKDEYSNVGAGFTWTHYFNKEHWGNFNIVHSNYSFNKENSEIPSKASKYSFEINHSELKADFNYTKINNHTISYGLNSVLYSTYDGKYLPLNDQSIIEPTDSKREKGLRNSIFIGDKWEVTRNLTIDAGIRGTVYSYLGPATIYSYKPGLPREKLNITDTTQYGKNNFIRNYPRFDYRIAGKYTIRNDLSVKASFNKLHQYLFLLSNNVSVSPTDKWKLCDPHIKPMDGYQLSTGVYKNFGKNIETSVEAYYKDVKNLVEFKDGADFQTKEFTETNIIQGNLDAYGVELMVKKTSGKLNGWFNYTYSRSIVDAVDNQRGEYNNLGFSYPANYDKPHAFNLTLNWAVTMRCNISANVVYSTGAPITYPTSIYYLDDNQITDFSKRNEFRVKDYFRVDLSFNFEGNLKKKKFAHGSWAFSIYNLTSRQNPYSVYFRNDNGQIKGYRLSIFGRPIPSITYNLKLGNYND